MKIKVTIEELTHEDLVNYLSTATYGNSWLSIHRPKGSYKGTELEDENDCLEDTWAKVLLNGGLLRVCDWEASDKTDFYGKLPHKWRKDRGCMQYELTLKDILKGLEKAGESDKEYIRNAFHNYVNDNGEFDLEDGDTLIQVALFGEPVYG